jgi:hypothetical protein
MNDSRHPEARLLEEVAALRRRVSELEAGAQVQIVAERRQVEEESAAPRIGPGCCWPSATG